MLPMTTSLLQSIVFGFGMLCVFIGERLIGAGGGRATTAFGVLLVLSAIALRAVRFNKASGEQKKVERSFLLLYAAGALALLFYFLQSDLAASLFGKPLERNWPKLAGVLGALWPAIFVASVVPVILVELSYQAVARAPRLEAGRVHDALFSGLGLAGALVFAFAASYVASERDKKLDLSYFRTARPGEASRKIVQTLDQPVQVTLFFPPANEVREEVLGYFKDLQRESKMLEVHTYDHAVEPVKAKEMNVSGNGIVVVSRGQRRELLNVGIDLEGARSQLRNLDKEAQKRILLVAKPQRTVYMTAGHGERSSFPAGETDKRLTVRDLREVLQQQGWTVKDLSASEGLAADVPTDAAIVMAVGPEKPFLPEEVASIGRYVDRGGRMLIALDPENGNDFKDLLAPIGLRFKPTMLASDQAFVRTKEGLSRTNLATVSYSSHPSVTTLGRLGSRYPTVLLGAGWLEELKDKEKPKDTTIDIVLRSHPTSWNDLNGNQQFDAPAESRKGWELGAAVTRKKPGAKPAEEGRLLVLADSDALADGVLPNPGNAYLLIDGTKWLLGEEAITGEVSSEVDVAIAHTHKQDVAWFYSTIFVAPAVALGIGSAVMRRRARARNKEKKS